MMFCNHCNEKREAEIVSNKYEVSPVIGDFIVSLIHGVVLIM